MACAYSEEDFALAVLGNDSFIRGVALQQQRARVEAGPSLWSSSRSKRVEVGLENRMAGWIRANNFDMYSETVLP